MTQTGSEPLPPKGVLGPTFRRRAGDSVLPLLFTSTTITNANCRSASQAIFMIVMISRERHCTCKQFGDGNRGFLRCRFVETSSKRLRADHNCRASGLHCAHRLPLSDWRSRAPCVSAVISTFAGLISLSSVAMPVHVAVSVTWTVWVAKSIELFGARARSSGDWRYSRSPTSAR
jgi:hypothetical protein